MVTSPEWCYIRLTIGGVGRQPVGAMTKHGKTKVIVNPSAGHGQTARLAETISATLARHMAFDLEYTDGPKHAVHIASQLHDYDLVIAVGGDGTAFEVANGLATSNNRRTALAVVPTGSGNDLRRSLGISKEPLKALEEISSGVSAYIDLGTANGTYFVNSVGIGFDGRIARRAGELSKTSGRRGLPLYLSAVFDLLAHDYHGHEITLKIDDSEWTSQRITLMAVTNGVTYGGGFMITPKADNGDGFFDICVIDELPRWQVLPRLPFVIAGRHGWMKPVAFARARKIAVQADSPLPAHLDGEFFENTSFLIEIIPRGLKVIVPQSTSAQGGAHEVHET